MDLFFKILFELGNGQWNIPELHKLLQETAEQRKAFEDYPVEHRFPKIGLRKMLLVIEDVTERH